ncbi:amino acid ABC transporter permease [Lactiplantibacillus mudanjiangensis]|uniref:Cysteine ABC transporter permease [Lactobacillus sp.] n=1 Tax=Lactiplantibacillus mudanjiangensis TaxID=1296538 RepID=A0A660E515_9LACO|nr:amino acid ABC transporter permease [Lactiplantibacillus mudanjiangensis]VDG20319.1 cysteine ABC transporter permease [Lactobacillus sp.] [Lactiplantibacillus mudanjiangensis]VDG23988.1 cysteine ABC transporter permease [Lactobacillus sp.] [Lactiplantibacillus mudanjiangensis]VDG27215.1 cysteine ABC transporter permease [Lactobacillus sp.] [Lactiplantibacillus mudanjiangensis]VDG33924.1 cysteine ABC transporter permease [Lactobacillus sp.] [Lactiplantibacillus mudanjiangensis]
MDSIWHIIVTATPQIALAGLKYTIPIALISFALGLILAVLTALVKLSPRHGWFSILKAIAYFYVWLFRSTPLLVQLFIVYFGLPYLKIRGLFPNGIQMDPWAAGIMTFSLNTGAYCAETIRASILSIPQGQWEAAASIGMNKTQVLKRIILPQAARVSLPPLSNSFIGLVKDTSLAASITIIEMFEVSQQIAAQNYQPLVMYSLVAALYAILCSLLSWLQGYLEKRTSSYIRPAN